MVDIDLRDDIERYKIPVTVSIIDSFGLVLASNDPGFEGSIFPLTDCSITLENKTMGYRIDKDCRGTRVISYGYSPGFETYSSGWYCVISEELI